MALLSTTAASAPQKQIALLGNTSSATLYTVPAGKTFTGYACNNGNMQLSINGVMVITTNVAPSNPYIPLTLVAGTVVGTGGSYGSWALIGVEQ